ncbi:MAG: putative LPS assembly protein LptD [Candidatus Krumholzibacteria bacterium]|nr:putative LPS assembly protein LptD [Candidatus Krumholzibacteria bacterium]
MRRGVFLLLILLLACTQEKKLETSSSPKPPASRDRSAEEKFQEKLAASDSLETLAESDSLRNRQRPAMPADLSPSLGSDREVAEDDFHREIYEIRGSHSRMIDKGDPRVSEIDSLHLQSDSLLITSLRGVELRGKEDDSHIIELYGEVFIDDRGSTITGDEGQYDSKTRTAVMEDNVEIQDGEARIFCDHATWFRKTNRSILQGNVRILHEGATVLADSVFYSRKRGYAEAFGNVVLIDEESDSRVEGSHGIFDLDQEIAIMDNFPVLYQIEESDSSRTTAREMRQFRKSELMLAVGEVHHESDDLSARGDSALFFQSGKQLFLYGNSELDWDDSSLAADSIQVFFEKKEPVFLDAEGQAVYREDKADSLFYGVPGDRISGDHFEIFFEEKKLKSVFVSGSAHSLYLPERKAGEAAQMNETFGDSLVLQFDEEELERVEVFGEARGENRSLENWEEHYTKQSFSFQEQSSAMAYTGEEIYFQVPEEEVLLVGAPASVDEAFHLEADSIRMREGRWVRAIGQPLFRDGEQELQGQRMDYDLESKEGFVRDGRTGMDTGFFSGPRMKKVGEQEINVEDGVYTTCDQGHPHCGFHMARVRVEDRKVFAAPVVLKIGRVPIFYLPAFFIDTTKGRRSGVLMPNFEFGLNSESQRFIRNLGYYWATSDYQDLLFRGDFIEGHSLLGSTTWRYSNRNLWGGSVNSNLRYDYRKGLGDQETKSWGLKGDYNQSIGKNTKIRLHADYASSSSVREIDHVGIEEAINQRVTSSLNFSSKIFGNPFSSGMTWTRHLDASGDDPLLEERKLPISYSFGLTIPLPLEMSWKLPSIKYSKSDKIYENRTESTETLPFSTSLGRSFQLGFLSLRPSVGLSYSGKRISNALKDEEIFTPFDPEEEGSPGSPAGDSGAGTFTPSEEPEGWVWEDAATFSLSASTKGYGVFNPNLGSLRTIRHTISPSASVRGNDRNVPSYSFSLDNSIDLKWGEGEDPKRYNGVLTWGLSSGYDPLSDTWNTVSSNLRLKPGWGINLSARHSYDPNSGEMGNSSYSGSVTKTMKVAFGSFLSREDTEPGGEENGTAKGQSGGTPGSFSGIFGRPQDDRRGEPGDLSLRSNFSMSRTSSGEMTPNLRLSSEFQLSEKWGLSWNGDLRLAEGRFSSQRLEVFRDLHCWRAQFSRLIYSGKAQYYFIIHLREHPEVKTEFGDRSVGGGLGAY